MRMFINVYFKLFDVYDDDLVIPSDVINIIYKMSKQKVNDVFFELISRLGRPIQPVVYGIPFPSFI